MGHLRCDRVSTDVICPVGAPVHCDQLALQVPHLPLQLCSQVLRLGQPRLLSLAGHLFIMQPPSHLCQLQSL